jgi:protein-disulfide isomerase
MTIRVVGWFGPKTEQTLLNAQAALNDFEPAGKVKWISDVQEMKALGISRTPAVIINEKLKSAGRVLSVYEIKSWIEKELVEEVTL